jgi:hypothetical protein
MDVTIHLKAVTFFPQMRPIGRDEQQGPLDENEVVRQYAMQTGTPLR